MRIAKYITATMIGVGFVLSGTLIHQHLNNDKSAYTLLPSRSSAAGVGIGINDKNLDCNPNPIIVSDNKPLVSCSSKSSNQLPTQQTASNTSPNSSQAYSYSHSRLIQGAPNTTITGPSYTPIDWSSWFNTSTTTSAPPTTTSNSISYQQAYNNCSVKLAQYNAGDSSAFQACLHAYGY